MANHQTQTYLHMGVVAVDLEVHQMEIKVDLVHQVVGQDKQDRVEADHLQIQPHFIQIKGMAVVHRVQ
jgi:hypothetical protein